MQKEPQKLNFKEWVKQQFGSRGMAKAARHLAVSYGTVAAWHDYSRYPTPKNQELLKLKSDGQIDFETWRQEYVNEQHKKAK